MFEHLIKLKYMVSMLILPPGDRLATISYFSTNLFLEKSPLKEPEKISLKTYCFDLSPAAAILFLATKFHSGFCVFVNIECNKETIFRIKL